MDELLTIAGTIAAVQLMFAGWREWCAARRIVAVGGLDADAYAEHGCEPLQYAGSRYWIVRAAVAATGFFAVRPKTRKQAFAARRIVGIRGGRQIDYSDIRPRDRLRVMLDAGEHPTVFDRSMRRGVVSYYRTVAIRDIESPAAEEHAHCVTVRTRGDLLPAADGEDSRWLEYEVTSAAPRSNRRSGPCSLADVPEDAIEIVIIPPAAYRQARDTAIGQPGGALRRRLMRHNPNPHVGLAHAAAKYAIPLAVLAALGVPFLGWATTARILAAVVLVPLVLLALPVCAGAVLGIGMCVRDRIRARRPAAEKPRPPRPEAARRSVPLRYEKPLPPQVWTGATARSMSAGRIANATDLRSMLAHAWRQFGHGRLPARRQ
ncbi:MAG: hypothetical protein OXI32_03265 [bacterium]|nr:hypothetical protein [bacterium]